MKLTLKLGLSITLLTALALSFTILTSEPASAVSPCPPVECPQLLAGYSYVGTCANFDDSDPCLGWIYSKSGQTCHVSALTGL